MKPRQLVNFAANVGKPANLGIILRVQNGGGFIVQWFKESQPRPYPYFAIDLKVVDND